MDKGKPDRPNHADKVVFKDDSGNLSWFGGLDERDPVEGLKKDIIRHIVSSLGSDFIKTSPYLVYRALALAVRDRLIDLWIKTQRSFYDEQSKRVYYLSLEYLPGKSLCNNLHCLQLTGIASKALESFGLTLEEAADMEWDAGLGNGGLGRLASCYLDSMASLGIPAFGYGIRYDYGMFHQVIRDGRQVEVCDNWMRDGNPWEFTRGAYPYEVKFYGHVREYVDQSGRLRHDWTDTDKVLATPCDMLVPGYANKRVINMRLWAAKSDREFVLKFFNTGDYIGAVHEKVKDENLSKVLYPSEEAVEGRELRLKQQYFFVTASLMDILRRFRKKNKDFSSLPDKVAIQLNDTHPTIAIPELMRILVDEEQLDWEKAWDICSRTFAYTNHTILPEALEAWPCELLEKVLPRHMQIIREINRRFMLLVEKKFPDQDMARLKAAMAVVSSNPKPHARMANMALACCHSVNGVSALHTKILKERVFSHFHECFPGRLNNKTNGVTPRRWLLQANPELAGLISEKIGPGFIKDLSQLKKLTQHADDPKLQKRWQEVKQYNKARLAAYIERKLGQSVDVESLFDVHVKRIHEYKRQMLNILHVIALYNRIRKNPGLDVCKRTFIFAGKAAPGYFMARRIIRLINHAAQAVNSDPLVNGKIKVLFLPNYCVSQAERIIPGTDLSVQISMAGMEASGTGNMKFALNGALTIGTLDGANVEMREEIGDENFFIFGNTTDDIARLRKSGYNPWDYYQNDPELRQAVDMISSGYFSPGDPELFIPLTDSLLHGGDRYFVLADFRSFVDRREKIAGLFADQKAWTRLSILNTAGMGKFSSDRAIAEYARDIWGI